MSQRTSNRIASILFSALLLPPLGVASLAQETTATTAAYRISGTVVSSRDGSPVRHCVVSIRPSGGGIGPMRSGPQMQRGARNRPAPNELSTPTDAAGHFTINLPSAGMWQLSATAPGFRTQMYEHHENFFSSIILTPAGPSFDAVLRLDPDSAITGYVIDEGGEAVRNARISLRAAVPASSPEELSGANGPRFFAQTDDQGHYEVAGLPPGDFQLSVQAEPWYAQGLRGAVMSSANAPSNPALDVVYPITWSPGVADKSAAEVITLKGGESRQVDFHLVPVPSVHLRLTAAPLPTTDSRSNRFDRGGVVGNNVGPAAIPQIERVSDGDIGGGGFSTRIEPNGQVDVSGLSPGLYRIVLQRGGPGEGAAQFLRVAGDQRSIDLSSAVPAAQVTLHFEGDDGSHVQVALTDVDTGNTFRNFGGGNLRRRPDQPEPDALPERTIQVPPGRYRIVLSGGGDLSLTGISIKGKAVPSRVITVDSGTTAVNLQLAHGRVTVGGTVRLGKQPCSGAMVMLVPATFGQAGSIDILRRDQTNTDGSFSIAGVLPGQYILFAIDRGWDVNWRDPATLQRYLMGGVPLVLNAGATAKQDIDAQAP